MKKIILFIVMCFLFFPLTFIYAQYHNIEVKEKYDFFNSLLYGDYLCTWHPSEYRDDGVDKDGALFGDGTSKILEGYVAMYKTTGDKAYLYKFIIESLCIMENRHDINPQADNNQPRWAVDPQMYHDGNILASFSRFIYLIKLEEPSLFYKPIYQFEKLKPINYQPNTCYCNIFGITFTTLGQYADWLQDRVGETLWWFINNGYWLSGEGFKKTPSSKRPAEINMQVGFGRTILFIGLTSGDQYLLNWSITYANLFKSNVNATDRCESKVHDEPVFMTHSNDAYWWYHSGWSVRKRNCFMGIIPLFDEPDYYSYTKYIEDISHGAVVTWLPLDYYNFQPNTPFTQLDMIRFRNMFTKNIYDGNGNFHNAVNGQNGPVYYKNGLYPEINTFKSASINYMSFTNFDNADVTVTPPNVYDIILEYYINNIHDVLLPPYKGQGNKGHAEIAQAQWNKECPNLTLYNRKVVYNQNFFAKGNLTVTPQETTGDSYAEPIISEQKFIVEDGTTVNMVAGNKIVIKPGTHIKKGANSHGYIDSNLCSGGGTKMLITDNNTPPHIGRTDNNLKEREDEIPADIEHPEYNYEFLIYPNPFDNSTTIKFSHNKTSKILIQHSIFYIRHSTPIYIFISFITSLPVSVSITQKYTPGSKVLPSIFIS